MVRSPQDTEDREVRPWVAWLARGLLAGATLGATEVFAAMLGSDIRLALPLLFFLASDTLLGGVLGLGVSIVRRLAGIRSRPDWAGAFVPLAMAISFCFLADKARTAADFRGLTSMLGVVILAAGLGAGALIGQRLLRRRVGRPVTAGELAWSFSMVSGWLVFGRLLTKKLFGSYFSAPGILANLVFLVGFVALVALQARRLARAPERPPTKAGAVRVLAVALSLPVLAIAVHDAPELAGTSTPRPGPAGSRRRPAPEPKPPDVILITLDTLRADRMIDPASGRILLPSLEPLAGQATVYTHAVTPSSWTLPAHASIFTGLLPDEHRADTLPVGKATEPFQPAAPVPLAPRFTTLAERLRDAGYATAAFVGNYGMLDHRLGVAQGFEVYDDAPRLSWGQQPLLDPWLWRTQPLWYLRLTRPYRTADVVVDRASGWIDRLHADRSLFLFVNLFDAHFPYAPPPSFTPEVARRLGPLPEPRKRVMSTGRPPSAATHDYFTSLYDGEISFMDGQLGRLLEHLQSTGHLDGALVVIAADHGEAFGEHGRWGHGYGPYEEVHHVPLLVAYPNRQPTGAVEGTVSLVDLFDLMAGAATAPGVTPLRARSEQDPPALFQQFVHANQVDGFGDQFARAYCGAARFPWKLVEYTDGRTALYDLRRENAESHDLTAERPEIADRLQTATHKCLETMSSVYDTGGTGTLDSETRQRLRGLGYLN